MKYILSALYSICYTELQIKNCSKKLCNQSTNLVSSITISYGNAEKDGDTSFKLSFLHKTMPLHVVNEYIQS